MKGVVVFDVCGTLFKSNTTIDFVLYVVKKRSYLRFLLLKLLMFKPVAYFLLRLRFPLKEYMLSKLAGYTKNEIYGMADDFFDDFLLPRVNHYVFKEFLRYRDGGHFIILASASIDVVISVIARRLNVDFVSSRLGYDGVLCRGALDMDITGKKSLFLPKLADDDYFLVMYTDNSEDLEMVNGFNKFYFWKKSFLPCSSSLICLKGSV